MQVGRSGRSTLDEVVEGVEPLHAGHTQRIFDARVQMCQRLAFRRQLGARPTVTADDVRRHRQRIAHLILHIHTNS